MQNRNAGTEQELEEQNRNEGTKYEYRNRIGIEEQNRNTRIQDRNRIQERYHFKKVKK